MCGVLGGDEGQIGDVSGAAASFEEGQMLHFGPPWEADWIHLFSANSSYQAIGVWHDVKENTRYLFINGDVQISSRGEYVYHEMIVYLPLVTRLCSQEGRRARDQGIRVFVLGAGDGGVVQRLLWHQSVAHVTQVELDEVVVNASRRFFPLIQPPTPSPRHTLLIGDGIEFARRAAEGTNMAAFDLAILDTPAKDPGLFSSELYRNVAAMLRPGGVLAQNLGGILYEADARRRLAQVREVFPHAVPFNFGWPDQSSPYMAVVTDGGEPRSPQFADCARRAFQQPKFLGPPLRYYSPQIHEAAFVLPSAQADMAQPLDMHGEGRGAELAAEAVRIAVTQLEEARAASSMRVQQEVAAGAQLFHMRAPWVEDMLRIFTGKSIFHRLGVWHHTPEFTTLLQVDGGLEYSSRWSYGLHEMMAYPPLAVALCTTRRTQLQVLVFGAGDGGVVQRLLRHPAVAKVTQVELDELLVNVSRRFFPELRPHDEDAPGARLDFVIGDAVQYAREAASRSPLEAFDLIIFMGVLKFAPGGASATQLHKDLAALLSRGGVLAHGAGGLSEAGKVRRQVRLAAAAFRNVVPFQFSRPDEAPTETSPYVVILAGDDALRCPRSPECSRRFLELGPASPPLRYYSAQMHEAAFVLPAAFADLAEDPAACNDSTVPDDYVNSAAARCGIRIAGGAKDSSCAGGDPAAGVLAPGVVVQHASDSFAGNVVGDDDYFDVFYEEPRYNLTAFLGGVAFDSKDLQNYKRGWWRGAPYTALYPETTIVLELFGFALALCIYVGLCACAPRGPRGRQPAATMGKRCSSSEAPQLEGGSSATPHGQERSNGAFVVGASPENQGNSKGDVYPGTWPFGRLEEAVAIMAASSPSRTALIGSDLSSEFTYGQLWERAGFVAAALATRFAAEEQQQQHERPVEDSLVGLLTSRGVDMIVGMLGILRASAGYVPMEPNLPLERLRFMASDAGVRGVCFGPQKEALANAIGATFCVDIAGCPSAPAPAQKPTAGLRSTAVVLYTSGSTGKPKGVRISHEAVVVGGAWHPSAGRKWFCGNDRVLVATSFSFYDHLTEVHAALAVGAVLLLSPPEALQDLSALQRFAIEYHPSVVHWVPSVLKAYLSAYGSMNSVQKVLSSGEPVPTSLASNVLEELPAGARYVNLYGATEVGNALAYELSELNRGVWGSAPTVPAGLPLDCEAFLADQGGSLQLGVEVGNGHSPSCQQGGAREKVADLLLAGPGLADGYVNLPELTAEVFVHHPLRPGLRAYRTGDLAKWLPEGGLQVLGRKDSQVKIHGQRVELCEVEEALRQVHGVLDAAAVLQDQCIIGYVTLRPNAALDSDSVLAQLESSMLPSYMHPEDVMILNGDFPRTEGARKIDRRRLPRPTSSARLTDSLTLMTRAAQGNLRASEAYQGNIYMVCQVLVALTHVYDHAKSSNADDWRTAGPASCVSTSDSWYVRWFHHHDVIAPDVCALLLMSAVADMRLLERSRRDLLRVAAFFLVMGFISDFANLWLAGMLEFCPGQLPHSIWMFNYLHGPGKLSAGSYECNYYVGNWFFRVRAGLALTTWCFSPVLRPTRRAASVGYWAFTGHIATVLGWALLFFGLPAASLVATVLALGCCAAWPDRFRWLSTEWPSAAPAVALLAVHCGTAPRRIQYGSFWTAVRTEVPHFFGFEDVWILSYFVLPLFVGGTRFPASVLKWKACWAASSLVVVAIHFALATLYVVGVDLLDPAVHDVEAMMKHEPGLLPLRFNTGWGFTSGSAGHIWEVYVGIPVLVVLFLLAVPSAESRASRLGPSGALVHYALHIPILCFQQSFERVRGCLHVKTALCLVTSVALLHVPLPRWVILAGWGARGVPSHAET